MKLILMRHGQDLKGYRGGWSNAKITKEGEMKVKEYATKLRKYNFKYIISSDLERASQTSNIVAELNMKPIIYDKSLREINNGDLAGMENRLAEEKYPNLYYNTLDFTERYPNGESPYDFFKRVEKFHDELIKSEDCILLVTHFGVINILYCIINKIEYSNKRNEINVPCGEFIVLDV